MNLKHFLKGYNFWQLPKQLVLKIGLEPTYMLVALAEAEDMLGSQDGWFYQTHETVESITGLTRRKQDTNIKALKELGLLEQRNVGVPMKRHFRINEDMLFKLVESVEKSQIVHREHSTMRTDANNKELNKELKNNNNKVVQNVQVKTDLQNVLARYSLLDLPNYRKITNQREKAILARVKEHGLDDVLYCLEIASKSEFLNKPEHKWYSIDWIFNPSNFVKILEGKYSSGNKADGTKEFINKLKGRVIE